MFILVGYQNKALTKAQDQKETFQLLAREVKQTSEDLTMLCRSYVGTNGINKFRENYTYICQWREGKAPRPDTVDKKLFRGKTISQEKLFLELGCTEEEVSMLNEATKLSVKLAALEEQAMSCIEKNSYQSGPGILLQGEFIKDFAVRILYDDFYYTEKEKIMTPINNFFSAITLRTTNIIQHETELLNNYKITAFICISIATLSVIVLIIMINKLLIRPILKTGTLLKNISQGEGDLSVRLPISGNDEITELSLHFNQTIEKIGSSIKTVELTATTMQSIGDELAGDMTESASAIRQITKTIENVKEQGLTQAASVTENTSTMEEIINIIEALNSSIEQQSASVVQSSASIEEMVANITSITQTLGKTDSVIKTLSEATSEGKQTLQNSNIVAQKISEESGSLIEASNVIQNIAEQTNLLAMNAAIEAAHAGEAGKGFAVVADEIRKLAEESSVQGRTITDTLKKLSEDITGLASTSRMVEEKFNVIFNLAENVRNMSSEITLAMNEQANGSKEVLLAIKDISRITGEVKKGSSEILIGGKNIALEMQKLDRLTINIKDSMNEMSAGVIQINNAVQEVNSLAQQNKDSISNLAGEVQKFKI